MIPVTFGVIVQKRDAINCIELLKQLEEAFPKNKKLVFFSGPTCACLELLNGFVTKSRQIELIRFDENKTLGYARNYLVNNASTSWVHLLEADTLITSSFKSALLEFFNEKFLDKTIGIVQGGLKNDLLQSNTLSRYDCLNDNLAFLSNRHDPIDWFSGTVRDRTYLQTVQGANLLVNKQRYLQYGGCEDISSGVDRSLGARIENAGYKILYLEQVAVNHHYFLTYRNLIKRKWFHAKGSLYVRKKYPNKYQDSWKVRARMFKSAVLPPPQFHSVNGRLYYFVQMLTFTLGLCYSDLIYRVTRKSSISL